MLNIVWPIFIIISFSFAIFSGNLENLNNSIFESTNSAISLSIDLLGTMCLWSGIMQIASKTSLVENLTRFLEPLLNFLFPKLKENKTYQNVTISNIQLTTVNGLNRLLASVTNNSNSRTDAQDISLVFVDNQGNTIATVPGVIPAMNAGETAQLNASTTKDIINAYDFRIE